MTDFIAKKVKTIIKSPLFWVLLVCGLWQAWYYNHVSSIYFTDSYSYSTQYVGSLSHGIIDPLRVPVYPTFVKIVSVFSGQENLLTGVAITQIILFFLSIIVFYAAIKKISNKKWLTVVLALLYGCLPHIINWNMLMLTESLSIIETVCLLYCTISFLKKPQIWTAIGTSVLTIMAILTRPAMIYLLPIFLLFWIIKLIITKKQSRKALFAGLYSCIAAILIIGGYCFGLLAQYGAFGLSTVSSVNRAWMVTLSGIELDAKDNEQKAFIDETEPTVLYNALTEKYGQSEAERVISDTIKKNKNEYLMFLVNKFANTSKDGFGAVYAPNSDDSAKPINSIAFLNFGSVYVIVLIGLISIIYDLFKRKKVDWLLAFLVGFIFCNVFLSIFMAPFETARLCAVSIPALLILAAYWASAFFYKDKKLRLEEDILSKKASNRLEKLINKYFKEATSDTKIQFFRYLFVGGLAAVVNVGSLFILKENGLNLIVANIIAFTLGLIVNYLLSRKFVFAEEKMDNGVFEFITYAVIGIVGLLLDTLFVWLFTESFGLWYMLSKVISTGLVFIWNFTGRKGLYIIANRFKEGEECQKNGRKSRKS